MCICIFACNCEFLPWWIKLQSERNYFRSTIIIDIHVAFFLVVLSLQHVAQESMVPLCMECNHSSKLTVVRSKHFSVSSKSSLHLVQCATVLSLWFLLCAACNDVSEHAYLVCSSVSLVDVKNKKLIQNKKNSPTDRVKFSGASRPETRVFFV